MRKLFSTTSLIVALFLLAGCAAQEKVEAVAANQEAKTNLECRKIRTTGSRLPERVCKTHVDWERDAEADREILREQQMNESKSAGSN
jgi:hypothetical protein